MPKANPLALDPSGTGPARRALVAEARRRLRTVLAAVPALAAAPPYPQAPADRLRDLQEKVDALFAAAFRPGVYPRFAVAAYTAGAARAYNEVRGVSPAGGEAAEFLRIGGLGDVPSGVVVGRLSFRPGLGRVVANRLGPVRPVVGGGGAAAGGRPLPPGRADGRRGGGGEVRQPGPGGTVEVVAGTANWAEQTVTDAEGGPGRTDGDRVEGGGQHPPGTGLTRGVLPAPVPVPVPGRPGVRGPGGQGPVANAARRPQTRDLGGRFLSDRAAAHAARLEAELKGCGTAGAQAMARVFDRALREGWTPARTAKGLREAVYISERKALAVARTELVKICAEAALDAAELLGAGAPRVRPEWTVSGDPCPRCLAAARKQYTLETARGVIPVHPSCLCSWRFR